MENNKIKNKDFKPTIIFEKNQHTISQAINYIINKANEDKVLETDDVSDGYHTFGELYEFRKMYNAILFNEWASSLVTAKDYGQALFNVPKYNVHKSWRHNDGNPCFGEYGNWFIVSAMLPTGLISNHYKAEDWDLFKVPEVEKALFEYDGHTASDVLERLKAL